jgi:SAM-dependent methyltransferase
MSGVSVEAEASGAAGARGGAGAAARAGPIAVSHEAPDLGSYAVQNREREKCQGVIRELLFSEPRLQGRVLDIGCGHGFPPALAGLDKVATQLDGLDPSPEVHEHPGLTLRWQGKFGEVDVPRHAYDLAYAYNVVEHVEAARPFFENVRLALKPGGVFWAITPHGRHPFCRLSRTLEVMGFKRGFAARNEGVNDYPAYYRMNTARQVLRAVEGLGFVSARFVYIPSMAWDHYFPARLRWAPHLYDRALGLGPARFRVIIGYRLEMGS